MAEAGAARRSSANAGVLVYELALAGGAAWLAIALERGGAHQPGPPAWWALPGLCALLIAAEYLFVRFRYAGEVNALNLFEAVLAPLLFFYPPTIVMGVVAGAQIVSGALRRNAPVKVAFNISQWTLAAGLAAATLAAVAPKAGVSLRGIGSLLGVLAIVGVVNQSAFIVVLRLANRQRFRSILRSIGPVVVPGWVAGWILNSLVGLLFVLAFSAHASAVFLFPVPLIVLHLAYRGYAGARSDRTRLTGLHRAARVLSEPLDPNSAIPGFLEEVARAFDARGARLVLLDPGERSTHEIDFQAAPSYRFRGDAGEPRGIDAVLLSTAVPLRLTASDPRAHLLAGAGWRDCLSAPLLSDGRVIGALTVIDQAGLEGFEEGELAVIEALARETTAMLAKGELLAQILEERRRLEEVVSTTSDGVFSLDAAGNVASWNRAMHRLTGVAETEVLGRPGIGEALDARDDHGIPVDFGHWAAGVVLPDEIRIKDRNGFVRRLRCSYSHALTAGGDPSTLVVLASDATPEEEIRELRQQFGRLARERVAQRAVVEQLQQAMMPARPVVPGVELAVSYAASDPASPTGGDLYDWQVLPTGDIHIAVVDVVGHGVTATKDALAIIHALRWLTLDGCALEGVIERIASQFEISYPDLVATAIVGRYAPQTGRLRIAGGGHPPCLLLTTTGNVRELPAPGCAIGWPGAGSRGVAEITLEPGDSVLFFTDGLVESTRDIVTGTERLMRHAVELADRPVDVFASEVVRRSLSGADRRDDSLALVLRRAAITSTATWNFEPLLDSAHNVRREFGTWLLSHHVGAPVVEDLELVVSELVTNAVHAARSSVSLRVWLDRRSVVLEVHDDGPGAPELERGTHVVPPSAEVVAGRGLYIVRTLSDAVSFVSGSRGTIVRVNKSLAPPHGDPAEPSGFRQETQRV